MIWVQFQGSRAKDSAKEGDVRTAFKTAGGFQAKTRDRQLHQLETTFNALITSLAYHLASFAHLYIALNIEIQWHFIDSTWRTETIQRFLKGFR